MEVIGLPPVVAVTLLVASLTAGTTQASAAPPGPPSVSAGRPAPTPSPVFTGSRFDSGLPSAGPLGVTLARVGRQVGDDRVVIELAGRVAGKRSGRWSTSGPRPPTARAGRSRCAAGTSAMVPPPAPPPRPTPASPARPCAGSGAAVVGGVVLDNVFDGLYSTFVGLSAKRNFRVLRLSNPPRIVVDIGHR